MHTKETVSAFEPEAVFLLLSSENAVLVSGRMVGYLIVELVFRMVLL